jgi:aspartate-semialdehyde dehydrogenase
MDRMQTENDFALIEPVFFSTSNAGGKAPSQAKNETKLQDAFNIDALRRCEIIISTQGGDYTTEIFPKLRAAGWSGHWRAHCCGDPLKSPLTEQHQCSSSHAPLK